MTELVILITVVILFSTVQSLFGVGLLVFGTPTLLLLDYPFDTTLALLLPSSLVISAMQVLVGRDCLLHFKKSFLLYSVPSIIVGLILVLTDWLVFDIKSVVGSMLLMTAALRYVKKMQSWMTRFLQKNLKAYLMAMGLVHGLSNMGGGLLTILITSIYDKKETIRANIAYGYLVFALTQILVLLILHPAAFSMKSPFLALISFATYSTVGSALFLKTSRGVYQKMITAFILAYGVVLVGQRFL